MADFINWAAVEAKLKQTQALARAATTVDAAVDIYTENMIEALKIMMSTAQVNGGTCSNGGPIVAGKVS